MTKIKPFIKDKFYFFYFYVSVTKEYMIKKSYARKVLQKTLFKKYNMFSDSSGKKEKLFILGSGSSINRLSSNQWNEISKNTSIGLNLWFIHDFIPTFYSFEQSSDYEIREKVNKIIIKKAKDYQKTPIVLKDLYGKDFDLTKLPKLDFRVPIDISIPGDTVKQFRKGLKKIRRFNKLKLTNKNILFKKRASISMMVMIGWQLGFKEIILCGVDLNNTRYFYEENSSYYKSKGIDVPESGQKKDSVHKTINKEFGNLTIDQVIYSINDILLKPDGIKLYTAFSDSALSEKLPIYFREDVRKDDKL